MSCDLIPPKLVRIAVKIAGDQLAEPITCIINSTITQSISPKEKPRSFR